MKGLLALLLFIALAMLSWGVYGPVLQLGKQDMQGSALRPFICVGMAYFLIAVLAPGIILKMTGEAGHWSSSGIFWSLAAGAAGAIGALGVILALLYRGSPLYVMPLVFGCAPVVNTFLTMYWARSYKQANPIFFAGLILVIAGAMIVLLNRPHPHPAPAEKVAVEAAEPSAGTAANSKVAENKVAAVEHRAWDQLLVFVFTAVTALAWGVYGPTLHRGQTAMAGSRLRPFLCVGLAYFLIAVIVPTLLLMNWNEPGEFTFSGSAWSLAGGAAGALGALGIIMAFNFGGKPIFVMPLVFGGAPVINTFVSVIQAGNYDQLHPMFYAGLIVVAAGAVTVLVFAPKGGKHPSPEAPHEPTPQAAGV
jgi:hypothetical protein